MDYFEMFDIKPQFNLDHKALKIKYLKLSKAYHPDFHTQATPMEQVKILEQSTLINKAYKTLSNPDELLEYFLEKEGLLDGKPEELPQVFLLEMMEFNERIMDLRMEPDPIKIDAIQNEFELIMSGLNEELSTLKSSFDESKTHEVLSRLRFLYFKKKYLNRISEHMDKLNEILS